MTGIPESNPYAPLGSETVSSRSESHEDFELAPKGIFCRSGLMLPLACLVTGRTGELKVWPMRIMWQSLWIRILCGTFPALCGMVPLVVKWIISSEWVRTSPMLLPIAVLNRWSQLWPFILMIAVQGIFIGALMLTPKARLKGFVNAQVHAKMRRGSAVLGGCAVVLLALFAFCVIYLVKFNKGAGTFGSARGVVFVLLPVVLCFAVVAFIGYLKWRDHSRNFPGLSLKVVSYEHGRFEIEGFSPAFLKVLREAKMGSAIAAFDSQKEMP